MKKLIVTLLTLLTVNAASAGQLLAPNYTETEIALEEGAQVLQVNIQQSLAVSCPGQLNLRTTLGYRGTAEVKFDSRTRDYVDFIKSSVSKSCSDEIFNFETEPRPVCLSYGHPSGVVYLNVSHIDPALESIKVQLPGSLEITSVKQLK